MLVDPAGVEPTFVRVKSSVQSHILIKVLGSPTENRTLVNRLKVGGFTTKL